MKIIDIIGETITPKNLSQVEDFVNTLWHKMGIDVAFTRHFMERLNDPRNKKEITIEELVRLFVEEYKQYGTNIRNLDDHDEAVFKDIATKINLPFVINSRGHQSKLIAKTIIRKPNFTTSNPVYAVENTAQGHSDLSTTATRFDPLLVEFWKQCSPQDLKLYFKQDNCYAASLDFTVFLETKGIGFAEVIKIGRFVNDVKKFGWVEADTPDYHYDALTVTDRKVMTSQQLNPRNAQDRANYINSSPELIAEFCWIPHSWVRHKGKILDPSGFYIDGKSGQFDQMVIDKSNLAARYHEF